MSGSATRPLPVHKISPNGGLECAPAKLPLVVGTMRAGGTAVHDWARVTCTKCLERRR